MRVLLFDNEAVQALINPHHRKHRRVLAHLESHRQRRAKAPSRAIVPTTVRVEAGWNRTRPGSAAINRLRITDAELDSKTTDTATEIRAETGISVVDAHLGATARSLTTNDLIILTSDPHDMTQATGNKPATIITI